MSLFPQVPAAWADIERPDPSHPIMAPSQAGVTRWSAMAGRPVNSVDARNRVRLLPAEARTRRAVHLRKDA